MIYGFGFFKVNYLTFSIKFVNYYLSELSENCFHSVVVKIILINYAKKILIHAWAGGKVQNG
jgi:hypothetical protein